MKLHKALAETNGCRNEDVVQLLWLKDVLFLTTGSDVIVIVVSSASLSGTPFPYVLDLLHTK